MALVHAVRYITHINSCLQLTSEAPIDIDWLYIFGKINGDRAGPLLLWEGHACLHSAAACAPAAREMYASTSFPFFILAAATPLLIILCFCCLWEETCISLPVYACMHAVAMGMNAIVVAHTVSKQY